MLRMQKQQSAVELLTTYAWAILIVAVFVAAVAVLATTRPPAAYLASSCNIQPLLPCSQTLLTTNSVSNQRFVVEFTNNLGVAIQFSANAINLTVTNIGSPGVSNYLGTCSPTFATPGAQVLCTVNIPGTLKPATGSQTSTQFTLNYNLCNGGRPSSCQTTVYKSTGLSTQNAAPSNINFLTVNFITVPSTGEIVLNGVTYPNGVNAIYLSGNYVIFGIPPSGYRFNTWQVTGSSTLSSTSLQNASLGLNANATLTANFILGATTSTVTFITTSTSTTSVSSTSTSVTSSSTTTTSTSTSSTSTTSTSTSTSSTSTSISTTSTTSTSSTTSTILSSWTLSTHYPVTDVAESCSAYNGYIYCNAGSTAASTCIAASYYAPISSSGIGAWASTTAYPFTTNPANCNVNNNIDYCIGGLNGCAALYQYGFQATMSSSGLSSWSDETEYPTFIAYNPCPIYNNYMYCISGDAEPLGGGTVGPTGADYYTSVASGTTGSWATTTSYPIALVLTSCVTYNGYIYCVGGEWNGSQYANTYYAPISSGGIGTWTATTAYPIQIYGSSCNVYNGDIYCIGGASGSLFVPNVYYAPLSSSGIGAWTAAPSYPVNQFGYGCAQYNGFTYCIGGNSAGAGAGSTWYSNTYYISTAALT